MRKQYYSNNLLRTNLSHEEKIIQIIQRSCLIMNMQIEKHVDSMNFRISDLYLLTPQ